MWIAVPVHTVHTVIDGNKVDAVLWKQHFRIHSDLQIVTPEPAHILNDNALDLARLDVGKHPLESGPVEVGSRISVVGCCTKRTNKFTPYKIPGVGSPSEL